MPLKRGLTPPTITVHKFISASQGYNQEITPFQNQFTSRPSIINNSDDKRKMKVSSLRIRGLATNERWVNADGSR